MVAARLEELPLIEQSVARAPQDLRDPRDPALPQRPHIAGKGATRRYRSARFGTLRHPARKTPTSLSAIPARDLTDRNWTCLLPSRSGGITA
jgi:hypothetical protein